MVAFGLSSPPVILDLDGSGLKNTFDMDPGWFVENLEDQFSDRGMQGVHVWEGEPPSVTDPQEDEELSTCNLRGGAWREPTEAEWVALRARRSPFNSDRLMLGSLVE